jgi:hypothetical protein
MLAFRKDNNISRIGKIGAEDKMPHVRYEVLTAVTMKNAVFWDIEPQFLPHTRHITSPLQSPAS